MSLPLPCLSSVLLSSICVQEASVGGTSSDWRAFRGNDGLATATSDSGSLLPLEWSEERNLAWKRELPGPGSSSPIVVGDRIFITSWSGYGVDREAPGDRSALKRHLTCLSRGDGEVLWQRDVAGAEVEDPYEGRLTTHGYASSTPVSDGESVFVFFGKRGVFCFDLDGDPKWSAAVGTGSSEWNTGSAPSPVLCGDHLLLCASDESTTLFSFDKHDGALQWKREDKGLELAFDTPVVAGDVVLFALLERIWGLDPESGATRFEVRTESNGSLAPSIVIGDGVLYSLGGQSGTKSYAVRLGGEGDVTESHVLWSTRFGSYVPSPVLVGSHLYWVDERGMAHCADASNGEIVYRERLPSDAFYASIVRAGPVLLCASRTDGTFVLPAEPHFEILAHNTLDDGTSFDGSPAVSAGQLLLRSGWGLYCIEDLGD